MKILAICRPHPNADLTQFAAHLPAEAAALRLLKHDGVLIDAYSPGRPGAVLILDTDPERADALLAELPLATAGLLCFETIPLHPIDL